MPWTVDEMELLKKGKLSVYRVSEFGTGGLFSLWFNPRNLWIGAYLEVLNSFAEDDKGKKFIDRELSIWITIIPTISLRLRIQLAGAVE